jgi:hypothetical protein
VSGEENEDLAAIEKLLKIKLPVQEPGQFARERVSAPRGGSRRPEGRPERTEGRPPRPEGPRRDQPAGRRDEQRSSYASRAPAQSTDPLFSKPYIPSGEMTQSAKPAAPPSRGAKKQVAALFLPPVPAEKQDA